MRSWVQLLVGLLSSVNWFLLGQVNHLDIANRQAQLSILCL